MPTLTFVWRPMPSPPLRSASYRMQFVRSDAARDFMERVLEGRAEARWEVRVR